MAFTTMEPSRQGGFGWWETAYISGRRTVPVKNWSLMLWLVVDTIGLNCVKIFVNFQISLQIAQWKVIWKALLIRFPSITNLSYHSIVYKTILLRKVWASIENEFFGFTQWLYFSHCNTSTKTAYKSIWCYCCTCVCSYCTTTVPVENWWLTIFSHNLGLIIKSFKQFIHFSQTVRHYCIIFVVIMPMFWKSR